MTVVSEDPGTTATRLRFYPRQLISADDLNQEQRYHREKLREHNRFLHGWGVVCGCDVVRVEDAKAQLCICPGYVLTPQGDAIRIRSQATFDVATCFVSSSDPCALARPCPPVRLRSITAMTLHLAVRYAECKTQPVRVAAAGCSCDGAECEYSRIVDAYEFGCLTSLPATHTAPAPNCADILDEQRLVPCPECPDDAWVVLATLTLSATHPVEIAPTIGFADRRPLPSVARLRQIERCSRP